MDALDSEVVIQMLVGYLVRDANASEVVHALDSQVVLRAWGFAEAILGPQTLGSPCLLRSSSRSGPKVLCRAQPQSVAKPRHHASSQTVPRPHCHASRRSGATNGHRTSRMDGVVVEVVEVVEVEAVVEAMCALLHVKRAIEDVPAHMPTWAPPHRPVVAQAVAQVAVQAVAQAVAQTVVQRTAHVAAKVHEGHQHGLECALAYVD